MRCAACGIENRSDRKFCSGCGGALAQVCPHCSFDNGAEDKFCGGCGQPLSVPVEPEAVTAGAERRPVSILFVDLSGFTSLSGQMDAEDVHRLLEQFFTRIDGIIVEFGGSIDKHIGDSAMGLFGAPIAHDNDPERAALAALAIQAAMPGLSQSIGRELKVHIGIASGDVLASGLGSVAHSAYTVTGEAANLAARLMELAAPGEILVSGDIAGAVAARLVAEPAGERTVRGFSENIAIFRLTGEGSKEDQTQRPLIGRRAELKQVMALIETVEEEGLGAGAVIRGEPGIGKSRLTEAFMDKARQRGFAVTRARILDFGAGKAQDPQRQIAMGLCAETGPLSALTAMVLDPKQSAGLKDILDLPLDDTERRLYQAMSDEARRRARAEGIVQLLLLAAGKKPYLLVIEDIHWADAVMLDLIAILVDTAAAIRVVLVMTSRIEGDPLGAAWRSNLKRGRLSTIDLMPLSRAEAIEMARAMHRDIDDAVKHCVERAEGNPLFLDQLLRARITDSSQHLPGSLQSVVQARLDQLPETDRQALQAASILGQRFDGAILARLIDKLSYNPTVPLQRQLIRPDEGGYLFAHALVREGIYASLTREKRRVLHKKAADLFAEREFALAAEHLERAEDPSAPQAYLKAAMAERAANRLRRAADLAGRGLKLAQSQADRVALGLAAGRARLGIGDPKQAVEAFQAALDANPKRRDCARALLGIAGVCRQMTDLEKGFAALAQAETLANALDDARLLAEIHYQRGNFCFALGKGEECFASHRLARQAAERSGEAEWVARAESGLGDAAYMQGRMQTALGHFRNCVEIADRNGFLQIASPNMCMVANTLSFALHTEEALATIDSALKIARSIGDRYAEMFALECVGFVLMHTGRIGEAEERVRTAIEMTQEMGARRFETILTCWIAICAHQAGRREEAREMAAAAQRISESIGSDFLGSMIAGVRALIAGPGPEGRRLLAEGEEMLRSSGMAFNHVFFRQYGIDWAIATGDWDLVERYAGELAQFTAAEPLPFVDFVIDRARALSRLHRNPHDARATSELARVEDIAARCDLRFDFPLPFS